MAFSDCRKNDSYNKKTPVLDETGAFLKSIVYTNRALVAFVTSTLAPSGVVTSAIIPSGISR